MKTYGHTQIEDLLSGFRVVVLGTCGAAGPQAGQVGAEIKDGWLILKLDRTSDHLFNLECRPELVILTPAWELHGTGQVLTAGATVFLHPWQAAIRVTPTRLHILDRESGRRIETVDFPAGAP